MVAAEEAEVAASPNRPPPHLVIKYLALYLFRHFYIVLFFITKNRIGWVGFTEQI